MKKRVMLFWTLFFGVAIFRVWSSISFDRPDLSSCVNKIVSGTGRIIDEPERKSTGQVFIVDIATMFVRDTNEKCENNIKIRMKTKLYPKFIFGETVSFEGKVLHPMNFESSGGRIFNYEGYLAKDRVYFEIKSAIVKGTDILEEGDVVFDFAKINSLLYEIKTSFVSNLGKVLGEPHSALASGLVVGEKAALGKDLLNDFRTVGLIHIVVLSGYNITIVADSLMKILSFLPRVWGIGVGGIGIALFGILVGGGATVVRSCIMAGIALAGSLIRRDYYVGRALVLAALIMIIQNPMILLHDPSFQLSFLATLGLILLAGPIEKRLRFVTEKFGVRGIVASTLATQIFVSPFILYTMGQISIIGIVVNVLVLPFIPLTMLFVFITGASGMFSFFVSQASGWVSHFLLSYELFMVRTFAQFPFASFNIEAFSFWYVVGFYAIFSIIFSILSRNCRR